MLVTATKIVVGSSHVAGSVTASSPSPRVHQKGPPMKRMLSLRGLVGAAVIAGLLTFVVLPALASTPGAAVPPPSTSGVTPTDIATGGQSNDCALFYAGNPSAQPAYQFRIAN